MAELADALVSGISDRKVVQVQVLFLAPEESGSFHQEGTGFFVIFLSFACASMYNLKEITMYHPFNGWFDFAPIRGILLATPKGVVPQAFNAYYPLKGF